MVSELEILEAQTACFDDNSSGSGSGNMHIRSVSSVDCGMVAESEKTKVKVACSEDKSSGSRSGNMKIPSVSLADFITASQIKQHLSSFNQHNRVILKNHDTSINPDLCELCWKETIMLAPVPIICEYCDFRIPPNVAYHRSTKQENKDTDTKTNTDTNTKKKTKTQNHSIAYVQHAISYLGLLLNYQTEILFLKQYVKSGNTIFVVSTIRKEIKEKENIFAPSVAQAKGLVVRVVLCVDKELEVNQQFRDIFQGKDYPEKLKYRSKEYGSECIGPNNRCVYISYLDSVNYFQPERKTLSGESLRTFVYHEILIGYLEYCKKRGFSKCYIWSCPVVKGQDYIFNCRPATQKTPKKDKLLKWYKLMLAKAAKEGIVVDINNLHEQFFVAKREENNKITAAHLPYFDGAYWLGAAETISENLAEEESSRKLCRKSHKKRILKALGHDNPTKDVLVMQQLGEKITPDKENFIIVRLQHTCTYCHEEMLCGSRWVCNQCNKIRLCSRCFDSGKLSFLKKMHKCRVSELSQLSEGILSNVPRDTTDRDGLLINNIFETRDDFLNKCELFQYQFNTLAHAKYSSMMILYHSTHMLVIQPVCTLCNNHVPIDQCWHCDSCSNLHVCESCYETKGDTSHNHKLTHPSTEVTPEYTKNKELEKQKVTVNALLDALVPVSRCKNKNIECTYLDSTCRIPGCMEMKKRRIKVTDPAQKISKRQRTTG
nr:zinc finger, TAZ-type [Tanacetum cinerariifolium]